MTVRYQGADAPRHVHLRDAMCHLANARRSIEHARWQTTDREDAAHLDRLDELLRRLGRTVARTGR